jgi:hypothetical protein
VKTRATAVALLALILCALALPTTAKPKQKKGPKNPPDAATGIAVDWEWARNALSSGYYVKGKAYNLSGKSYRSVFLKFVVWAKDGDKMGETLVLLGAMPDGSRAPFQESLLSSDYVNGDKPNKASLIEITAYR